MLQVLLQFDATLFGSCDDVDLGFSLFFDCVGDFELVSFYKNSIFKIKVNHHLPSLNVREMHL